MNRLEEKFFLFTIAAHALQYAYASKNLLGSHFSGEFV